MVDKDNGDFALMNNVGNEDESKDDAIMMII